VKVNQKYWYSLLQIQSLLLAASKTQGITRLSNNPTIHPIIINSSCVGDPHTRICKEKILIHEKNNLIPANSCHLAMGDAVISSGNALAGRAQLDIYGRTAPER
jgi:hypothetical protein